jgi:hypothetical protein
MVAKYGEEDRESFVVYTDRASLTYSKTKFVIGKVFSSTNLDFDNTLTVNGYEFTKSNVQPSVAYIDIKFDNP